ncbi:DnaJ sub B member 9 [Phytophthora pseudosyringae]|uniref:DnaJ sub B member 9 n=1 Tax=Phytophthora pseudosyringae TaxID=221518 RepID=A0A8T1VLS6_9STRA|nr:DnaJ sub B member 9 [Phytophthora pseudosyringae]
MASITHDRSRKTDLPPSRAFLLSRGPMQSDSKPEVSSYSAHPVSRFANSLMYGVVNSIRAIPTVYGYAAIIFSHPAFLHYMPALSKLVIFSSAIHQLMFTLMSSLPFAIGQVQNVGLIFLSAMATSICNSLNDNDDEDVTAEAKIATTIVTIGVATASLGVCLVIMGRFKLAGLASYLPMPVIGGYLAYTGIFCLFAGFAVSTGLAINDFSSMLDAFKDVHNIILCLPGFLGGALLLTIAKYFKNPFALSTAIVAMPVVFFLVLVASGISLDDARESGWIEPADKKSASMMEIIGLYDASLVHWDQIPRQVVTWLGMVFIVAFSSSLDVVAIEIDMGSKLNINHELKTVGWSNIVSGLFGGYTGSYNFEQTIFTCRSKTNSRIVGLCVILAELAIVAIPVSVMSHVPAFFVAATLVFVALDLMLEWLVLAYRKMYLRECAVVWLTFLAINFFSLELGIVAGVGVAALNFMIGYVRVPVMNSRPLSSAPRPNFGESAVTRFSVAVPNFGESTVSFRPNASVGARHLAQSTVFNVKTAGIAHFEFCGYLFFGSAVQILDGVQKAIYVRKRTGSSEDERGTQRESSFLPIRASWDTPVECLDGTPALDENAVPTEFVVVDFSRVSGMDATAAHSAFAILQNYCRIQGIRVVFTNVRPDVRGLLLKSKAATESSFFATAESALEFCAKQLLPGANDSTKTQRRGYANEPVSLLLHRYLGEPDSSRLLQGVDEFFSKREVPAGHEFYHVAEPSEHFCFLARGSVNLLVNEDGSVDPGRPLTQLQTVLPGAMFGEVFFLSQQPRQTAATAAEPCTVFEMSHAQFDAMKLQTPTLSVSFLDVIVQSILK